MPKTRTVLFVDEAGEWMSGASRCLFETVVNLDRARVVPCVACPEGAWAGALREKGVRTFDWRPPAIVRATGRWAGRPAVRPDRVVENALRLTPGALQLARIAATCGADALHGNTYRANLTALAAGRLLGRRVVWHVRECARPDSILVRKLAASADAVVFVSRRARESFEIGRARLKNATVIPDGVDRTAFHPGVAAADLSRFGFPPGLKVFGMFARFAKEKGHETFLEAAAETLRVRPDAGFLIAGDDLRGAGGASLKKQTVDRANALGLCGRSAFAGAVHDVAQAMKAMTAVVCPSTREGFGRSALEALAVGVPVLGSPVGAVDEMVRDGINGYIVPIGDAAALARAMVKTFDLEPGERSRMEEEAAKSAEAFDVRRVCSALEALHDA